MSDELYELLTAHRHDNIQLFKDWTREKMRRQQLDSRIDALHGAGATKAIEEAYADGSIFSQGD